MYSYLTEKINFENVTRSRLEVHLLQILGLTESDGEFPSLSVTA